MSSFVTNVKKKTGCSKCRWSKRGCNGPRCKRIGPPIIKKAPVKTKKNSTTPKKNKKVMEKSTSSSDTSSDDLEETEKKEQENNMESVIRNKRRNTFLRFIDNEAVESSDTSQSSDDSDTSDDNSDISDYDFEDGFLQEDGKVWKKVNNKWTVIDDKEESDNDITDDMSMEEQIIFERNRAQKALDDLSISYKKIKTIQRKHNETITKLRKKVNIWKKRATEQLLKNDKCQEKISEQEQKLKKLQMKLKKQKKIETKNKVNI